MGKRRMTEKKNLNLKTLKMSAFRVVICWRMMSMHLMPRM
jgi:hypothetical protein